MPFFGEIIALGTVFCWTVSIQFFEAASRRIGSPTVNVFRITIAVTAFMVIGLFTTGSPLPLDFPTRAWVLLSLSGFIGFFLGDLFLFHAFVEVGPMISMLIMTLSAPTAALVGWFFIGETYLPLQWLGMGITLTGVSFVILERKKKETANGFSRKLNLKPRTVTTRGLLYAFGGMIGQAGGYVMSKSGMQAGGGFLDPFASTQIRAMAAFVGFIGFFTVMGYWPLAKTAIRDRRAVLFVITGALLGTVLGVSLSLYTLHFIPTGVASTIFSMVPVFLIPFSVFLHREHISLRALVGAVIAVSGICLLKR